MITPLNIFLLECDFAQISVDGGYLSWPEVQAVVEQHGCLLWMMKGEGRILPHRLLADALRVHQAQEALIRLGRASEIATSHPFTRDQTIDPPWSEQKFGYVRPVLNNESGHKSDNSRPADHHPD